MNCLGRYLAALAIAFTVSLMLCGCVANKAYREGASVLHELAPENKVKYSLAFVEFDDVGEMFTKPGEFVREPDGTVRDDTELGRTLAEIERINRGEEGPDPIFVLFIHGWKNNASKSNGNVWGFRSALQSLATVFAPRPVMGIYLGWRGAATNLPVVKEFTFWNRKNAATRIPGAHLTEAVRRITMAAKSNPHAKCVLVGHSFGGLVLERTLTQAMVEMILEYKADTDRLDQQLAALDSNQQMTESEKKDAQSRIKQRRERAVARLNRQMPDLTVLLNEAGPATESKEFLNFLGREQFEFSDGKTAHPLFLSMTSTGDMATHIIFPVGQFLGKHALRTRKYRGGDEFGETSQNEYFLHTTANSSQLVSHVVVPAATASAECRNSVYTTVTLGKPQGPGESNKGADQPKTYDICPSPGAKNRTPYWVMQVPTAFVPDHSTVFKPELRTLLEAFMKPALKVETRPEDRIRLRRMRGPELKRTDQQAH